MSDMNQMFQLSLAAILVVFFVLGMIALVMIVLKILVNYFQYGGKTKLSPAAETAVTPVKSEPAQESAFPAEVAAAITAAISEFTQGKKFVISSIIEKKPNSWQMMSRLTRLQRLQRKW